MDPAALAGELLLLAVQLLPFAEGTPWQGTLRFEISGLRAALNNHKDTRPELGRLKARRARSLSLRAGYMEGYLQGMSETAKETPLREAAARALVSLNV